MGERRRYRSVVADSARWEGFTFRTGDIVISTPPKCGTTWMQTLVALLVFDTAELDQPMAVISPWLDMQLAKREDVFALLDGQQHRRFIKTHTPLDGLPYDDRVTYVCVGRDPRDVAVSSAHHMGNLDLGRFLAAREQAVGLDDLAELGMAPRPDRDAPKAAADAPAPVGPGEALLEWIESTGEGGPMSLVGTVHHLDSFWQQREAANVAMFHYGDLLADLPGQLRRLADTLEIDVSDRRLDELAAEATFTAMKSRASLVAPNSDAGIWRSTEEFFHRGSSGQWRDVFGEDELRRYDERIAELAAPDLAHWMHYGLLTAPPVASA
jgi:aryl sulfotransferase